MTQKRDTHHAPVPTLAPLFGGSDKKPRLLDKDVLAVGRARGCDITLDANEVSAIHGLFYRSASGWRVRDCGSRTGTRLNGNAVKNSPLADGDVLQIGPFSFEVKVPAVLAAAQAVDPRQFVRSQHSRRKLARLALRMRRKLRAAVGANGVAEEEPHPNHAPAGPSPSDAATLDHLQHELAEREHRLKDREDAWARKECDAQADCEEFERERQAVHQLKVKGEAEQARQNAELLRRKAAVDQAEAALRDQRAELTHMVHDLRQLQEELRKQPRGDQKALQQENQQLRQTIGQLEQRVAAAGDADEVRGQLAAAEKVRVALTEELAAVRERLAEVEHTARTAPPSTEVTALRAENDELRQLLQRQLFKPSSAADEEVRAENKQLRQILTEYEQRLAADIAAPPAEAQHLRDENELLRRLLLEKDKVLEELRQGPTPENGALLPAVRERIEAQDQELQRLRDELAKLEKQLALEKQAAPVIASPSLDEIDLDSVEAELSRERRQLQTERGKLNKEIEALRAKNAELDEATRDLEMELSRERAEMARERMRLERMREEIKVEMERLQRDGGVRESLAPVQRLRDEIKTAGARR